MKFLNTSPARHSLFEDALALVAGTVLVSVGVLILAKGGLLAGGTAGLAFLVHYLAGFDFGIAFFVINLPFYWLAFRRMGWPFTVKTFIGVALVSGFSAGLPLVFPLGPVEPLSGGFVGGILIGSGMLALFRHRASLGGVGILALFIEDRFGIRAGLTSLGIDLAILLASFAFASPIVIAGSVLGAITLNLVLAVNHRRDRYIAM